MKGSWPWNKDYSKQKQGVLYLGVHLFLCTYASPRYSLDACASLSFTFLLRLATMVGRLIVCTSRQKKCHN